MYDLILAETCVPNSLFFISWFYILKYMGAWNNITTGKKKNEREKTINAV
jgi:hypothetical protein